MKDRLDKKSVEALVTFRLQRAKDALLEAEVLIDKLFYNAAVNRLYYACYYAVSALLVKNKIDARTHAGVKHMLGLHFSVTGILPAKYSRFYSQLFSDRMTGDYDDFAIFNKEILLEMLPEAKDFIFTIENLIEKG